MWAVFERFDTRILVRDLAVGSVAPQFSTSLVIDLAENFRLRPDIVITGAGRKLVVDTKYKSTVPTSGDLYRVCAYAGVMGVQDVMLLYAERTVALTLTISRKGVRVHICGVDLEGDREAIVESVLGAAVNLMADRDSGVE